MSAKIKKGSNDSPPPSGRIPVFKAQFSQDIVWWARTQPNTLNKVLDLIEAIMEDPFQGIGKPEPLKYIYTNTWSRRITQEHRLIYRITQNRIYFLQACYHY